MPQEKPSKRVFSHIYLAHKKDPSKDTRVTIGVEFDIGNLNYAFSWCNHKDRFVKREGIKKINHILDSVETWINDPKCIRRLKQLSHFNYSGQISYYRLCKYLLELELGSDSAPKWTKDYKILEV